MFLVAKNIINLLKYWLNDECNNVGDKFVGDFIDFVSHQKEHQCGKYHIQSQVIFDKN